MNRHVALQVFKLAPRYTETALDEIKLLQRLITSSTLPSSSTTSHAHTHPGRSYIISGTKVQMALTYAWFSRCLAKIYCVSSSDGVSGTFTGVLDLRGIVKIINGIAIVKAAGSPDWTQAFDQQMNSWLADYVNWSKTSSVGQITASRPKSSKFSLFYVFKLTSFLIVPVIMAHSMPRKLQPRKFYWGISKVPHWNFRNSALARSWIRWHNPGSSHSRPYVLDHSTIATLISRH